jgi:hypothetical protein
MYIFSLHRLLVPIIYVCFSLITQLDRIVDVGKVLAVILVLFYENVCVPS